MTPLSSPTLPARYIGKRANPEKTAGIQHLLFQGKPPGVLRHGLSQRASRRREKRHTARAKVPHRAEGKRTLGLEWNSPIPKTVDRMKPCIIRIFSAIFGGRRHRNRPLYCRYQNSQPLNHDDMVFGRSGHDRIITLVATHPFCPCELVKQGIGCRPCILGAHITAAVEYV